MSILTKSLDRLPLNTKLLLTIGVGFVITLVIGLAGLVAIRALSESTQHAYEQSFLGVTDALEAKTHLTMMGRDLRWMAMSSTAQVRAAGKKSVSESETELRRHLAEGRKRILSDEGIKALHRFDEVFPAYSKSVEHAIQLLDLNDAFADGEAIEFLGGEDYNTAILTADAALDAVVNAVEDEARLNTQQSLALATRSQQIGSALLALGLLGSIGFGMLVSGSIRRPMNALRNSVEDLAAGRLDIVVPHTEQRNEIGAMATSLCILQQGAQAQISANWVKAQSAELLAALQGLDDMAEFARELMARLTPLLSAQVGAFFYRAPKTTHYVLLGSHAYLHRKGLKQQFAVGEGLVGQCIVERASITVSALDEDYIQIASGLGKGAPRFLIVAPLITPAGEIPAVIEFATLAHLGQREQALLDEVLPMLAVSINILERNINTRQLLDESQSQQFVLAEQAKQMELLANSARGQADDLADMADPVVGPSKGNAAS